MKLYNEKNKEQLLEEIKKEEHKRFTLSVYKYTKRNQVDSLRDTLYFNWIKLGVLGRVYLATEGINAQLSIPENRKLEFIDNLYSHKNFNKVRLNHAVSHELSFYKLSIKIKKEIVAYRIPNSQFNMNKTGKHLNAEEFNTMIDKPNTVIIDMRNHYENEVGKFENAILPDVDTAHELLPKAKELLEGKEDENILLYCTGGIRCEKASSYLIHHNYKNVYQLKGGIINYAKQIKEKKLLSKFKGKNFVFDARLGESITEDIISICHQCNNPCDEHINCENDACHILFIQCSNCNEKFKGCCSNDCKKIKNKPIEEQRKLRKDNPEIAAPLMHHYRDRLRPKLKEMITKKISDNNK